MDQPHAATHTPHSLPHPAPSSQFELLKQKRFAPFFWTQFFGAANDNIFKIAFTGLVTYHAALFDHINAGQAAFLISAIFIIPFVLFSATAGQLADKLDKSRIFRAIKSMEVGIMLLGSLGFVWHNANILYVCTFLMGLHSTFFGPAKYAYLPQQLRPEEVVGGNGMTEMGTFVAILIGTIIGGELADIPGNGPLWVALSCIAIAVIGRVVASRIPLSPADQPDLKINWNPVSETWRNLKLASQTRSVFLSLLGISWLWFFGVTFLTSFFNFAKDVLGGDPQVVTLLLAVFSIGIGIGSLLCERLSGEKVEIGLVPFGSIGMTVFTVDLFFAAHHLTPALAADGIQVLVGIRAFLTDPALAVAHWRVLADLFLMAMFSGFYSVPLYAVIQTRCESTHRARIVAANNIMNALFMVVSTVMALVLFSLGCTLVQLYLVVGLLNAIVALYIYSLLPEFLMRFLAWLLIHTVYRVRSLNALRIPEEGAAVLVCNHVSYVDAVVIMAESPRPIRFVMDYQIFRIPILSFIFRTARAIPIASAKQDPALLERAYDDIDQALKDGDLVCIFPEGRLTQTGELSPFRTGVRRIVERTPVDVIPMALRGLWGSFFSRFGGTRFDTIPRPLRHGVLSRLELTVGEAIAAEDATPELLQEKVLALRGEWK